MGEWLWRIMGLEVGREVGKGCWALRRALGMERGLGWSAEEQRGGILGKVIDGGSPWKDGINDHEAC